MATRILADVHAVLAGVGVLQAERLADGRVVLTVHEDDEIREGRLTGPEWARLVAAMAAEPWVPGMAVEGVCTLTYGGCLPEQHTHGPDGRAHPLRTGDWVLASPVTRRAPAALVRYVSHQVGCAATEPPWGRGCTCGLEAALARAKGR